VELVPELEAPHLTGGVLFYDAQMYSSERLVLEVVQAASAAGAVVANYVAFDRPVKLSGPIAGARMTDMISRDPFHVRARVTVNAAGPAVAALARRLVGHPAPTAINYSLALNVVLPSRGHRVAFTVSGMSNDPTAVVSLGKRQFFLVPWRGRLMIGTGHYPYSGDPLDLEVGEGDVMRFVDEVNTAWPEAPFEPSQIALVHSGLVPVAAQHTGAHIRFLKRNVIIDHAADGAPNVLSALPVKFTAARRLAQDLVDLVFAKLDRQASQSTTASTPLPGATTDSLEDLVATARCRYGRLADADVLEYLVRAYGRGYERLFAYEGSISDWNRRVVKSAPVIKAQWVHAVREEMAQQPDDLIWRRTELGARGMASEVAGRFASDVLAASAGS
jgi:glycerol-3-phosphate dehydrogenase